MSDIENLEQRLRELAAAPEDTTDWEDVRSRAAERPFARRLSRRRLVLALVAAVVVAASLVGVFVVPGTRPTSTGLGGPTGLDAPGNYLSVTYNRSSDGALTSITVWASPEIANASAELEVFGGPRDAPGVLVYQQQIPLSAPLGPSSDQRPAWTGTLFPSDWKGGCRAGWRYHIDVIAVPPGTSLADATAETPAELGQDPNREVDGVLLRGCGPNATP